MVRRKATGRPLCSPWSGRPVPFCRARTKREVGREIATDLGVFMRAGWADGAVEPDAYTDIDGSVAAGLSLNGKQWGRPNDTFGLAGIVNEISKVHQN
jgi:high affinity Mn2+ porin